MPAILTYESDALVPFTTLNFGAIDGGTFYQQRVNVTNTGTTTATSISIALNRITSNDGIDYTALAPDVSGTPGTYSTNPLTIPGGLAAGAVYWFWVKVTVPVGASPQGNPRQVQFLSTYAGT